jgi:CubicO group peptidase (beta-lactamase class C family)
VLAILMGMLVADGTYDLGNQRRLRSGDSLKTSADIRIADLLRMSGGLRFRGRWMRSRIRPGITSTTSMSTTPTSTSPGMS